MARNVARIRVSQGLTTRRLADTVANAGVPLSSSGVTDIELGRRRVTVDQLTALAAALGVAPLTLLQPYGPNDPDGDDPTAVVELSGTDLYTADKIYRWLRAERSLTDDVRDDYERETFYRDSNPRWAWKRDT